MDNPGTANTGAALTNTGPETPDNTVSTARPQDALRRQIDAPLHRIFKNINGDAGVVVIVGLQKGSKPRVGYFRPDQAEAMLDFIEENERQQLNSYVYYGLRRPGLPPRSTGTKTDVSSTIAVIVDIDDPEAAALAEERVRALGVTPTYVLETSRTPHRRFQIAWLFRGPETNFQLWLAVATKLRDWFGADRTIIDIAHCWRIPATTNFPDADKAAAGRIIEPAILIEADWDARYTLDELAARLGVQAPPPSNDDDPSSPPPLATEANADWIVLVSLLPPEARRHVENPSPKGSGSRSEQDYWLIARLRERGFTFEQIVQLYTGGAARGLPFAARFADEDKGGRSGGALAYLRMTWDNVARRHGQAGAIAMANAAPERPQVRLVSRSLREFLAHQYPPVEYALSPWLPCRGLAMIWAYRGLGKTWLGIAVAIAIGIGGRLLKWSAPAARRVVYVDGEMDPAEMQARFNLLLKGHEVAGTGDTSLADNVRMVSHADQEAGIPDLADPDDPRGRDDIERELTEHGADILVLDNLSCLCRTGVENDAESWSVMQNWLVSLRRRGFAVLVVHHGGKPDGEGQSRQRGTSKREDVLNTSIGLHKSKVPRGGTHFKLEYSKARGFTDTEAFEAWLRVEDGAAAWEIVDACGSDAARIAARLPKIVAGLKQGKTQAQIAKELGVEPATISRDLKRGKIEMD